MPPQSRNNQSRPTGGAVTQRSTGTQVVEQPKPTQAQLMKVSVLHRMADRLAMHPERLQETLLATVFQGCSREEFAMLLVVADELKLNPLRREIYAFPKKGGGVMPIVSIDGWITIVQNRSELEGFQFVDMTDDEGNIYAVECTMHRSDRKFPTPIIEYLDECKRDTEPWRKWPTRMLRHKAFIQAARYTFGMAGIYDEEEVGIDGRDLSATPLPSLPPARTDTEGFADPASRPGAEVVDEETGEVMDSGPEAPEDEGPHPAEAVAQSIIVEIAAASTVIDLNNLRTRHHEAMQAMPDEIADRVSKAFGTVETRLKGGK